MKPFSLLSARGRSDSFTLLVLLPTRLIRADLTGGAKPTISELWESPAPSGETPAVLAEAALALGPAKGRRIYVLASGAWSQLLQVPPNKVAGLSPAELANALSFEAEALSGTNPFDSAIGYQAAASGASGERGFWVTQMSATELVQLEASVARAGATLLGVLHPGGLARSWSPQAAPGGAWQRVELWSDIAFAIDAPEGAPARVHALASQPGRAGWEAEADQWFASHSSTSPREVLALEPQQLLGVTGSGMSLADEAVLRHWLLAWAAELSSATPHVPVIIPAPKPVSDKRRAVVGVTLALAALALCLGHAWWLKKQQKDLSTELATAELPEKRLTSLKGEAATLEKNLETVRRQGDALRALRADWTDSIARERRRHATLLGILTDHTPEELTISTIDESGGQLKLSGIALQPHFEPFATSLATGIDPLGWRYEPPRRRALNLSPGGGPWLLDWSLHLMTNHPSATNLGVLVPPPQPPGPAPTPSAAPPPGARPNPIPSAQRPTPPR